MNRDNHDKEILRALKSVASSLKIIAECEKNKMESCIVYDTDGNPECAEKTVKCKNCNGKGFVPLGNGIRGIKQCDFCCGTGEVFDAKIKED